MGDINGGNPHAGALRAGAPTRRSRTDLHAARDSRSPQQKKTAYDPSCSDHKQSFYLPYLYLILKILKIRSSSHVLPTLSAPPDDNTHSDRP